MSNYLVLFVAFVYLVVGVGYLMNKQIGLGGTFIAYSVSNVFLYLTAIGY
jgi:hypothetical protein